MVDDERVENRCADSHSQQRRRLSMGLFANVLDHFGVIFMPPGADLIGDVTYSNDMALAGRLRDERTHPGQTDDDAGVLEFAKGSARGHSRHPKLLHQFGLGLQPVSWLQFPAAYRVQHILFDRDISDRKSARLNSHHSCTTRMPYSF